MAATYSINPKTHQKALKKAKKENISVSTVVGILLNDWVEGKIRIGSIAQTVDPHDVFTDKDRKEIEEGYKEFLRGEYYTADQVDDILDRKNK